MLLSRWSEPALLNNTLWIACQAGLAAWRREGSGLALRLRQRAEVDLDLDDLAGRDAQVFGVAELRSRGRLELIADERLVALGEELLDADGADRRGVRPAAREV